MSGAPIYVVVCQNDKPHPRYGVDPHGPIVHETYVKDGTLELQQARAAVMERWGACRVGRVVFEGEPGFEVASRLCTEGDCTYFGQQRPSTCCCSKAGA